MLEEGLVLLGVKKEGRNKVGFYEWSSRKSKKEERDKVEYDGWA